MSEVLGLDPADWAMWRAFTAMRVQLDHTIESRLQRDAGLSAADFDVLRALTEADGHMLRAGGLAEALGWEKSRISHQVSRMTARGLLHRRDCPTDARGTWVVLSPAGAEVFSRATCGYVEELNTTLFAALEPNEREVLRAVTERVTARLAHRAEQPAELAAS
jgi:DNA-binding MarR family transcriptional regulator